MVTLDRVIALGMVHGPRAGQRTRRRVFLSSVICSPPPRAWAREWPLVGKGPDFFATPCRGGAVGSDVPPDAAHVGGGYV